MFTSDIGFQFFHSGSRVKKIPDSGSGPASKNLSINSNPKNCSRKYDPGCSSRITDPDFLPIPDPGSRIQGSKRHRIPDQDPQHCWKLLKYLLYVLKLFLIRFRNYWRGNFCHSSLNKKTTVYKVRKRLSLCTNFYQKGKLQPKYKVH
jgi:hypothetical protein